MATAIAAATAALAQAPMLSALVLVVVAAIVLYQTMKRTGKGQGNYATMPGPKEPYGAWFGSIMPGPEYMRFHRNNLQLMLKDLVIVADPVLARQMLKDKTTFPDRAPTGIQQIIPLGLLGLDTNAMWEMHHKTILPMFAGRFLRIYGEVFASMCRILFEEWDTVSPKVSVEVHEALMRLSLDALGSAGFGTDFGALRNPKSPYLEASNVILQAAMLQAFTPVNVFRVFFRSIYRSSTLGRQLFVDAVDKVLKESENDRDGHAEGTGSRSMHMLAEFGKTDLPLKEIEDELLTVVLAGHETTANAMTWLLYELARNPDVQERVQAEIDAVSRFPDFQESRLYDLRDSLPLLQGSRRATAAIAEGLRLYPSVPVLPRKAVVATSLGGYDIPAGTRVNCSLFAAFRNPAYFEAPEDFILERHLGERGAHIKQFYLPFGDGHRFAQLEEIVVIFMLLRRYRFTLDRTHPVRDLAHITLVPENGIKLFIERR